MLTIKQVALRLNVSAKLVYALCAAGRIECVRYGLGRGTIRISEEALNHYMEQAKACAAVPALATLKHLTPPSGRTRA
jgi:excisionase family DNA binding protein